MSEQTEEVKPEVRKITQKIVGYRVKTDSEDSVDAATLAIHAAKSIVSSKPTKLERGDVLHGSTYKIKQPPLPEAYKHGFYMTINNINVEGKLVPYELLIDTKNSECWPMLRVLTFTLTTLFRHQLDISHLLEEYHTVQDGKGGYRGKLKSWQEKPKYYNSILGEFADVIGHHLTLLENENTLGSWNHTHSSLPEGYVEYLPSGNFKVSTEEPDVDVPNFQNNSRKPANSCPECKESTLIVLDGCPTCTDCGYSKCG